MYFNTTEQIIVLISSNSRVYHVAVDNQPQIYFAVIKDTDSGSELTWRMIALLMNKELERKPRKVIPPNFDVLY